MKRKKDFRTINWRLKRRSITMNTDETNKIQKTRILIVEDEPAWSPGCVTFEYEGIRRDQRRDGVAGLERASPIIRSRRARRNDPRLSGL